MSEAKKPRGRPHKGPVEPEAIVKVNKSKTPWQSRNSPVIGDNGIAVKPGDNARYAGYLLEFLSWGRVDKQNIDELEERLARYVAYCAQHDIKIGNQVCYMALGINKDDVYNWEHQRHGTPEHRDFIKKVKFICAGNREFLMQDGKINPVTGIFWQKNYDGLKDQQEMVLTPNRPLGAEIDENDLRGRYELSEGEG